MRCRQQFLIVNLMDLEPRDIAAHALQPFEPFDRHFRASSNKLQKVCLLTAIKTFQHLPEPLNNLAVLGIVDIFCIISQIDQVYHRHPRNHELELSCIKDLQQVTWDQIMEAFLESFYLLLYFRGHFGVANLINIICLIFLSD